MLGWEHTFSRDYAEAVENGQLDEDLDRMLETVQDRINRIRWPTCPFCEQPMTESMHVHDVNVDGPEWRLRIMRERGS